MEVGRTRGFVFVSIAVAIVSGCEEGLKYHPADGGVGGQANGSTGGSPSAGQGGSSTGTGTGGFFGTGGAGTSGSGVGGQGPGGQGGGGQTVDAGAIDGELDAPSDVAGDVADPGCTPGTKQCHDLQPQECDAKGVWQNMGLPCPYVCANSNATCTGKCSPGAKQCGGSQPQVCDTNGTWRGVGPPCDSCNPCSMSTGLCVAATGNPCSASNICITGSTCQADSSCGGGSNAAQNTPCGNSKYCDGNGVCKCRTKSSWNLLANPGFDGSATGWSLEAPAKYLPVDVDGFSESGSILIGSPDTLSGSAKQCVTVPVGAGRDYYIGFRFKSSVSGSVGVASCSVSFIPSGEACDFGGATDGGDIMATFNNDNWIAGASRLTAPAGTATIRISCSAVAAIGYYDQLYISTTSPGIPAF